LYHAVLVTVLPDCLRTLLLALKPLQQNNVLFCDPGHCGKLSREINSST